MAVRASRVGSVSVDPTVPRTKIPSPLPCVVFLLLLDFRLDADADAGTLEDSSEGRDDELCCDIAEPLRGPRRGSVGAAI